jgi:hypothetical protein
MLLAPASVLGWGEVATRPVPGGGPASCLRSAGPGLLSTLGPLGRRTAPFDLVAASDGGLRTAGRAPFGLIDDCADAAANGSGTVAVAGADYPPGSGRARVRVTFRDAGRRLVTRRIGVARHGLATEPVVAVGPAGDVAVGWVGFTHVGRRRIPDRAALYVARRPPGGSFSAPRRLDRWRMGFDFNPGALSLGLDGAGRVTVVWAHPRPARRTPDRTSVQSAAAARGQALARRQRLLKGADQVRSISLSVTPAGEALVAFADFEALWLFERRAGRFVARRPRGTRLYGASEPAVAEAPDGSAVVAWRVFGSEPGAGGVTAIRRRAHGRFSAPQELSPTPRDAGFGFGDSIIIGISRASAPMDEAGRSVRAGIAPDGRAIVTWIGRRTVRGERRVPTAYAAVAPRPSGRFRHRRGFGSPCRPPNGAAPVRLRSGRLGLAWTDSVMSRRVEFELPRRDGVLHLALPRAKKRPTPAPPRIAVRAPRIARFFSNQPLPIKVRCNRACDVRASLALPGASPRALGAASLAHRGTAAIRLHPINGSEQIAPRGGGRLRLRVHACRAGAPRLRAVKRSVLAFRRPTPPFAQPFGVTARRHGRRIVVRWRTAIPARRVEYVVIGLKRRHSKQLISSVARVRSGHGRRRFRVVLHAPRGVRLRWVLLDGYQLDPPHRENETRVRIR